MAQKVQYTNMLEEYPVLGSVPRGTSGCPMPSMTGMEEALNYIMHCLGFGGMSVSEVIEDLESMDFDDPNGEVPGSFEETLRDGLLWSKEGIAAVRELVRRIYGR